MLLSSIGTIGNSQVLLGTQPLLASSGTRPFEALREINAKVEQSVVENTTDTLPVQLAPDQKKIAIIQNAALQFKMLSPDVPMAVNRIHEVAHGKAISPEEARQISQTFSEVISGSLIFFGVSEASIPADMVPAHYGPEGVEEVVVIRRDITESKRAEEAMADLKKQYAQMQKQEALRRLVDRITHKFNNYLQAIIGFNEIALANQEKAEKKVTSLLTEINEAHLRIKKALLAYLNSTDKKDLTVEEVMQSSNTLIQSLEESIPDGTIELLRETLEEAFKENRMDLMESHGAAKKGVNTVLELMDLWKPERYSLMRMDVFDILCNVKANLEQNEKFDASKINLSLEGDKGCLTKVDKTKLEQLLLNIGINALDAVTEVDRKGNIMLGVERVKLDKQFCRGAWNLNPGEHVKITVRDNGIGMSSEVQKRIFNPYYTTKHIDRGTGLGLAIAYPTVHGHGGHLVLTSEPGEGTTFEIYLRYSPEKVEPTAPVQATAEKVKASHDRTVLIVDDELLLRKVLRKNLNHIGILDVAEAKSGQEAVKLYETLLRENKPLPGIVIMDLTMPKMDGWEATKRIRELDPKAIVIIFSGDINLPTEKLNDSGASGNLAKPADRDKLLEALIKVGFLNEENDDKEPQ